LENETEHSPKPHADRPGNGHGEDKPHQDVVRARVTQDQLRFYGVGMSLPQWVSLFDDYRERSVPSDQNDAVELTSLTSHCCHDTCTPSLLRWLLASSARCSGTHLRHFSLLPRHSKFTAAVTRTSVRSPEGFSDIALSKVGFEDLSFSAKATNCDSHLKALAMVTTVR